MQKQTQRYAIELFIIDLFCSLLSVFLAVAIRRNVLLLIPERWEGVVHPQLLPLWQYLLYFFLILPFWAILLYSTQQYRALLHDPWNRQMQKILHFATAGTLFVGFLSFALKLDLSRPLIFIFLGLNVLTLVGARLVLRWALHRRRFRQVGMKNVLIVGADAKAREIGRTLQVSPEWGLHLVGYVTPGDCETPKDLKVLGRLSDLASILDSHIVDEVFFASSDKRDLANFDMAVRVCEEQGISTRLVLNFFPETASRVSMEFLDGVPVVSFSMVPDHHLALLVKRILDFSLAVLLLTLFFPLMVVVAILVKLTSPGPILYRQRRCGLYGRPFTLIKFRSMMEGAEDVLWEIRHLNEMDGPVFKMRYDPRVTRLGKILRKTSIDELPQLWNVLKGEMSLVGPRAPLPEEVAEYTPAQRRRLSVKPGITCLWQVSGRSEIDFQQWMSLDLKYIDNWSLLLDLKILLKTILVVLLCKGAR